MKTYKAKTLFSGYKIGLITGENYIAVPDKGYKQAEYNGQFMPINLKKAEKYETFEDKYGRGSYTLAYFQWKPIQEQTKIDIEPVSAMGAFANMPEDQKNELRKKLGLKPRTA